MSPTVCGVGVGLFSVVVLVLVVVLFVLWVNSMKQGKS